MIRILYSGDYALISTTFLKGMNSFSYGEAFDERNYLLEPLKSDSELKIDYLPTPYVSRDFPSSYEEISKYDVILISDVGTDTILMYPDRFKIPMGPNRLKLLEEFVRKGGGFAAVGGWMAFGGQMGQAKYHGTVLEDIMNISVSPYDDRVEVPEGLKFNPIKLDHPLINDMEWESSPLLFLGYNRFKANNKDDILAEWNGDPMMVANQYYKGRALAFASDLAPHWGQGFINWKNYAKFWSKCFRWLANK